MTEAFIVHWSHVPDPPSEGEGCCGLIQMTGAFIMHQSFVTTVSHPVGVGRGYKWS